MVAHFGNRSPSRSDTSVTIAAGASTVFACFAVSSQRRDSSSDSGRSLWWLVTRPGRFQTLPPTKPRQAPVSASTAIIACTRTPYLWPVPTGPGPRRRSARVGNVTSVVSWIASTCRPRAAAPVDWLQLSTIFVAVTLSLPKKRPARSSPRRSPPRRFRHTVSSATICSRIAPPLRSRRRSPNQPTDHSMAAHALRLSRSSESYSRRVGQTESQVDTKPTLHVVMR